MPVSSDQIDDRMRRFSATCIGAGLKVTHQRTEIFRELAGSEEHPDADLIFRRVRLRVPAISRDTVYRTLAALEKHGLVRKAEILDDRGRYDANTSRHHHFVCTECGAVRDFYSKDLDALPIPRGVKSLGSIESTHVQVRGICIICAAKKPRSLKSVIASP
ncbi:MAG TPA: transcriptional repressor [Pirellulales bacterium]|jgi:Fur family peroxide stress response transcriptional regulator|nr:transcriptional repressor [Pirellulales bacterium]